MTSLLSILGVTYGTQFTGATLSLNGRVEGIQAQNAEVPLTGSCRSTSANVLGYMELGRSVNLLFGTLERHYILLDVIVALCYVCRS